MEDSPQRGQSRDGFALHGRVSNNPENVRIDEEFRNKYQWSYERVYYIACNQKALIPAH